MAAMARGGGPPKGARSSWKRLALYPVLIYAAVSLEIAAIALSGFETGAAWVWVVSTALVVALLVLAAATARPRGLGEGLRLGAVWASVFFLLDVFVVAVPFAGLAYFADLRTWLPYVLGLAVPALLGLRRPARGCPDTVAVNTW
jgi:hypothetical protein